MLVFGRLDAYSTEETGRSVICWRRTQSEVIQPESFPNDFMPLYQSKTPVKACLEETQDFVGKEWSSKWGGAGSPPYPSFFVNFLCPRGGYRCCELSGGVQTGLRDALWGVFSCAVLTFEK